MKKMLFLFLSLLLFACVHNVTPTSFVYKEIKTDTFNLYSYQKILDTNEPIKIYIEGDGHAFNFHGQPTKDPTPKSSFLKNAAFSDSGENVVYLARPCQYILDKNQICSKRHWTTARFAPEIIHSTANAIKQIAGNNEVILIGFSGGAQVAGLVAVLHPDIKIKKLINIAPNLDHLAWTQYHQLPSLSESLNLADYKQLYNKIPQVHYIGGKDKNITPSLVKDFISNKSLINVVDKASHNYGWDNIIPYITKDN